MYDALANHGDELQKKTFLPHLTDGSWSGTMCLTEPHCGTDLGLIKTRAVPDPSNPSPVSRKPMALSHKVAGPASPATRSTAARVCRAP